MPRRRSFTQPTKKVDPQLVKALKEKIETAKNDLNIKLAGLKKVKTSFLTWILGVSIFYLIYPGCLIPWLFMQDVHDAVPSWYTGLIRILLLIAWVISCVLVWLYWSGRIAEKRGETKESREELARLQARLKEAS